jgi:hypothetical protein
MQWAFGIRSFRHQVEAQSSTEVFRGEAAFNRDMALKVTFCEILRRCSGCNPAYFAVASALFSRALRRSAALRWMTPFLAALSIAEIAARTWSAVRSGAKRICFCSLRRCVLTLRLRTARRSVCRDRFAADLVLAIGNRELSNKFRAAALATTVCSVRVLIFAGHRRALHPSAFVLH